MRGLFQELKRRNVYRVAATYAVVGFVVVQVADLVFPALNIPPWAYSLVVVLVLLGFPVALVLAWAFEMTPEGVRRTPAAQVAREELGVPGGTVSEGLEATEPDAVQRKSRRAVQALVALGFVGAVAVGGWYLVGGGGETAASTKRGAPPGDSTSPVPARSEASGPPRVVVLPLESIALDSGDASFARGMHDALQNQLGKVSGLEVLSRNTGVAVDEAGLTAGEIARRHDVSAILDGSVQRVSDQLRIAVQLTDARQDAQLWEETYDREYSVEAVFDIQGDIAQEIAGALETELTPEERRRIAEVPTSDRAAWESYVRGRIEAMDAWNRLDPSLIDPAVRLLQDAVRRDSTFAEAHAWLGLAYGSRSYLAGEERWKDSARTAVDRALSLDPRLPDAHSVRGLLLQENTPGRAEEAYLRALELEPNHWLAADGMADLAVGRGEYAEAVGWAHRVVRVNPRMEWGLAIMGSLLRILDLRDEAAAWLREALAMNPENVTAVTNLVRLHLSRGEDAEAREIVQTYRSRQPDHPVGLQLAGEMALRRGSPGHAKELLERIPEGGREVGDFLLPSRKMLLGLAELRTGQPERGRSLLREAVDSVRHGVAADTAAPWERSFVAVGLARGLAALGRSDEALSQLRRAADGGVVNHQDLRVDLFFEDLRSDPRFQEILARMEARQEEHRAEVREMDLELHPPAGSEAVE